MDVREIFASLRARMLEGMVFHDEMCKYFSLLSLDGYAKCHQFHYAEENVAYRRIARFYIQAYDMLIPVNKMNRPDVIPQSWYDVRRQDVDRGTKQSAVKKAFEKWATWETETCRLYKSLHGELTSLGEVGAARMVEDLIRDVEEELSVVKSKHLWLETIGYDLVTIAFEQMGLLDKYMHKIKKILG